MMKKMLKYIGRFLLNKVLLVLFVVILIYIVMNSKGGGHFWGVPANAGGGKVTQKSGEQEKIVLPMRFVKETLEVGSWSCPNSDCKELKKFIEDLHARHDPQKVEIIIEYYRDDNDPYILAQEAEKMFKENGMSFFIKKNNVQQKEKR